MELLSHAAGALTSGPQWGALQPGEGSAMRNAILANATYAWLGDDATLASWPCAVTGTVATAGGSGTTLGTINGRPAAVFNGLGNYRALNAFTIAQPFVHIAVCRRDGAAAVAQTIVSSAPLVYSEATMLHRNGTNGWSIYANAFVSSAVVESAPVVLRGTFNGVGSSIHRNRIQIASGAAGPSPMAGVTIGAAWNGTDAHWIGPIALVVIVSGANYEARAAAIEAAALSWYSI